MTANRKGLTHSGKMGQNRIFLPSEEKKHALTDIIARAFESEQVFQDGGLTCRQNGTDCQKFPVPEYAAAEGGIKFQQELGITIQELTSKKASAPKRDATCWDFAKWWEWRHNLLTLHTLYRSILFQFSSFCCWDLFRAGWFSGIKDASKKLYSSKLAGSFYTSSQALLM